MRPGRSRRPASVVFHRNVNLATNAPAAPALPLFPGAPTAAAPGVPSVPNSASQAVPSVPAAPAAPEAAKPPEEMIPAGNINFQGVDVNQVLDVYAKLVGRTVLRAGLPTAQIVLRTETPLTKTEAIQALQAVLALNGISLVNVGEKFVKVLPVDQANSAGAKMDQRDASQLPEMGSYVTHIVQLKYTKPSEMIPIIQPFAKLANSILAIDSNGILVLRDNAENVKRMLEMIDQVDVSVPAEYISEVIPIRYALAEDIASALNSLGGGGGSTVSIGSSAGRIIRQRHFTARRRGRRGRRWLWRPGRPERGLQSVKSATAIWLAGGSRQRADRRQPLFSNGCSPSFNALHGRRTAGPDPGIWPDENHRRPAEQFTAHFRHGCGHGTDQGGGGETGRAARPGAD